MSDWKQAPVDPAPPETLYHYASLASVLGIADRKELWASEIRYMNDSTEFTYAHQLLAECLRKAATECSGNVAGAVEILLSDLSFASRDAYFTPCRSLISPHAGRLFHAMPVGHFT